MDSSTTSWKRPELLGTTWRNRATGEVAVVLSTAGLICLVDVDWELQEKSGITDSHPLDQEPKHWRVQTEGELRRHWLQVKAGWMAIEP